MPIDRPAAMLRVSHRQIIERFWLAIWLVRLSAYADGLSTAGREITQSLGVSTCRIRRTNSLRH
jgi:hypothetical protein